MLVFLYNSTKGKTMRLYIIGNGFDMRHGLPTGYKHFKSYVEKNDQDLYDAIEEYIPAGDTIYQFATIRTSPQNPLNIKPSVDSQFVMVRVRSLTAALHDG